MPAKTKNRSPFSSASTDPFYGMKRPEGDTLKGFLDRSGSIVMIQGPRRIGKTMLVRQTVRPKSLVEVSLYGLKDSREWIAAIGRAVEQYLGHAVSAGAKTRTLKFGLSGIGIEQAKTSPESAPTLDRIFSAIAKSAGSKKTVPVVFIDEVQTLMESSDGQDFAKQLRTVIQQSLETISLVLAGSSSSLLRTLHSEQRAPFYKQATPVDVGALPDEPFFAWVNKRLGKYGFKAMNKDVFDGLLDFTRAIPGDVQRILEVATAHLPSPSVIDGNRIEHAIDHLCEATKEAYLPTLRDLTKKQVAILLYLAVRDRSRSQVPLTSHMSQQILRMPGGTIMSGIDALAKRGLIAHWRERVFVDDPFFETILGRIHPGEVALMRSAMDTDFNA